MQPVAVKHESMRECRRRTHNSYRQYTSRSASWPAESELIMRNSPVTAPTEASAKFATRWEIASGWIACRTSVKKRISPEAWRNATFSAADLPLLGILNKRTRRSANDSTICSVASVEPSETTTISIKSRG